MMILEPGTKGQILLDTIVDNGKKLGKLLTKIRFANESTVIIIRAEEEFEKDTVFTWQQKQLPTLVVKSQFFGEIKWKNGKDTSFTVQIWTFLAKGAGGVRSRILNEKENKLVDFDVVEIKDRVFPPQN